ncbi:MAG: ribulose-phosphate 3-epimerase [Clostridia bacterium]|nr:ribulose-phosphate 3-epimerase [Clostridia bacterium]
MLAKNTNKILIAPSILSADFAKMGEEVENLQKNGADIIHIDVMDGVFVPNITMGIKMVKDIAKYTTLPLDTHLMIVEPWKYIEQFAKAGSDYITVHYEACKDRLKQTLDEIKSFGAKCGLVINPDTPVERVASLIPECDIVLVMSVFPGFGGQKFIDSVLPKIQEISTIISNTNKEILLEVDGGINFETCALVKKAGANVLVSGNTIFSAPDRAKAINKLRAK